jgi:hypothetical protein
MQSMVLLEVREESAVSSPHHTTWFRSSYPLMSSTATACPDLHPPVMRTQLARSASLSKAAYLAKPYVCRTGAVLVVAAKTASNLNDVNAC